MEREKFGSRLGSIRNLQNMNTLDYAGGKLVKKMFLSTMLVQIVTSVTGVIGMVVDGAVTGSLLGQECMAAYGLVTPILTIFAALSNIIGVGTSAMCGRLLGRGDIKETEKAMSVCLMFSLSLSLIIAFIVFFAAGPIASALGAEGTVHIHAVAYLKGYAFCAPPLFIVMAFMPLVQLDSDGKRVFISIIAMTAVNIALDFTNALALEWGMLGMALATTVSTYAALAILMTHFAGGRNSFKLSFGGFEMKIVRDIFILGFPIGFALLANTVCVAVVNAILLSIADTSAVAVYAMLNSGGMVLLAICQGIGNSVQMLTSFFAGEGDIKSLEYLMKTAFLYSAIGNGIMVALVLALAVPYSSLFFSVNGEELIQVAGALRLYALQLIPAVAGVCIGSYLHGMKNYKFIYPYVFLEQLAMPCLMALALGNLTGLDGVWLSFAFGRVAALLLVAVIICVRAGKIRVGIRDVLMLPKGFGIPDADRLDGSVCTMPQVISFSESAVSFCLDKGESSHTAMVIGLCVEEMACNIVEHGFSGKRKQSIDIRISYMGGGWVIRIKDDCDEFNPVEYAKLFTDEDPLAHAGIRLISGMADSMNYIRALRMNNLIITLASFAASPGSNE